MTDIIELDAIGLVAEERRRQIEGEGYLPEHDNAHITGDLAKAAACYITPAHRRTFQITGDEIPDLWPWDDDAWKPTPADRIRELVKGCALAIAEIDRIHRFISDADTETAHRLLAQCSNGL